MKTQRIVEILKSDAVDTDVVVKGWVRTKRGNKNVAFIALNDGSCVGNIQVVVDLAKISEEQLKPVTTGACLRVDGRLVASPGAGQGVEVQAEKIEVYGTADPESYPLQKKGHSLEFLREIAYLRPRTNTFGAVLRIRHAMAYAIHEYFNKHGFYYFHTPIITASDCEGAGAMFQVTTLDMNNCPGPGGGGRLRAGLLRQGVQPHGVGPARRRAGRTLAGPHLHLRPHVPCRKLEHPAPCVGVLDDRAGSGLLRTGGQHGTGRGFPQIPHPVCAGQLHGRPRIYEQDVGQGLLERLHFVLEHDFKRLDYTEGIEILKASGRKFEFPCDWGCDLQSEHERYLVEEHFKRPVILINYPKDIKAFYMKQNDDGKTVRAMDVLFPESAKSSAVRSERPIMANFMQESPNWA